EAADRIALVHRRQPPLLLLFGAPLVDREHRERALHRDERSDPRVARLELEACQAVRDRARTGQPIALEMHAEETEVGELLRELARQDPLLEPLPDFREDPL